MQVSNNLFQQAVEGINNPAGSLSNQRCVVCERGYVLQCDGKNNYSDCKPADTADCTAETRVSACEISAEFSEVQLPFFEATRNNPTICHQFIENDECEGGGEALQNEFAIFTRVEVEEAADEGNGQNKSCEGDVDGVILQENALRAVTVRGNFLFNPLGVVQVIPPRGDTGEQSGAGDGLGVDGVIVVLLCVLIHVDFLSVPLHNKNFITTKSAPAGIPNY